MKFRSALSIALFVYFTASVGPMVAETPAKTSEAAAQPAAEPVSLDLSVRDRHNEPVLDLKQGDITVTDNGKPAKLTDLKLMDGKGQEEPLITLFFDRPGMEDSKRRTEDSLFATSASAARESSKRLRQQANNLLKAFPASGFRFAVVDVWGRLQIQQEESDNRKATAEAVLTAIDPQVYGVKMEANALEQRLVRIAKTGQDSEGKVSNAWERTLARSMYTAMQTSGRVSKDQHLSQSQACLLALTEAQQSLPGRKAIVYFMSTEGGIGDPNVRSGKDSHGKEALNSIIGAANRAHVNIYVVLSDKLENPGDLITNSWGNGSLAGRVGSMTSAAGTGMSAGQASSMNNDAVSYSSGGVTGPSESVVAANEDMDRLATQTGGAVLYAGGHMTRPVKTLAENLTTYYEASFDPSAEVKDGSFHTTVFRATRRGLRMQGRRAYLAMPPNAGLADAPQPFELPLMALLKQQDLPRDLDYRAAVLNLERGSDGNVALVALETPVSGLELRTDASTNLSSAHISVLATIKDSGGMVIEHFSEDIARRWSAASSAGTAPAFISFERSFAAPPGKYVLETAVIDSLGGKASAKRQAFEIPTYRWVPDLSDLIVVRGMEPLDNEGSEPDLLWRADKRVLPNLYGQLPAGAHSVSVFFLAHTDPKSQLPATVKLEVLRDGTPLKGKPLTSTLDSGQEFSAVVQGFQISSAANGEYELKETLIQGEKSTTQTAKLVLTGAPDRNASESGGAANDAPITVEPPAMTTAEPTANRPTEAELSRILEDTRKHGLQFADTLPDLICEQTTHRLFDTNGSGNWTLKDTIVEQLTYVNHEENRTLLGQSTAGDKSTVRISSTGEFGAAMTSIFQPDAKANFTWAETVTLHGEPAEVFDYRVEQANSNFMLNNPPFPAAKVGYHGRIYIDQATHGVMSLSIITDEAPKHFPIRKAAVRVDYDYVAINDHDYLLPVSAQVVTKLPGESITGKLVKRNDIAFSNFRKFGSSARIVGAETPDEAH